MTLRDFIKQGTLTMNAIDILDAIYRELDGKEWSPDTLDRIAAILETAGFEIREP